MHRKSDRYPNTPESLALANDEPWDDDMYDRAQARVAYLAKRGMPGAHLEAFYVEVFLELANYGEIEVKYYHEEDAERALMKLTGHVAENLWEQLPNTSQLMFEDGRFYSGKLIQAEYTTVSDFREARCRAFHETRCNRGAYCPVAATRGTARGAGQ
eukprot:Skav216448  [mRNA]  locus=scaffold50:405013:408892:+ [translate_table: standard]